MKLEINTQFIKSTALELGFDFCGISKAEFLADEAPKFDKWLNANMHGEMLYMQNHYDKRLDPRLLVDGAKSVISLLYNYYPETKQEADIPKISKYAYGNDYHEVIKKKLFEFSSIIKDQFGELNIKACVDSAPVMDRAWAKRSGLGWIGKNSNLINKGNGSFFFIAELILDIELIYDHPIKDYCGKCTRCIEACPTDAIVQPYVVDGSKCISYFTIELKNEIDAQMSGKFDNWIFGCDVCQDVCPWNRFSKPNNEIEFKPLQEILRMNLDDWKNIEEETFKKVFRNSPIKRTKYKGMMRNLKFIQK
jgi:epoxyqueuosine reductase